MKNIPKNLLMSLILTSSAATSVVYAQMSSSASMGSANPEAMRGYSAENAEKMKEHLAKHQAEMHDRLKITSAQEPAWKTFSQAMAPANMPPRPQESDVEKLNTPERMALSLARMKQHEATMQTRLNAVKTLYAVLTPEQQKIFDEGHNRMRKEMQERMARQMDKDGK
ncbi:Spy/CpxP family protein refolding chaperone [Undibacterium sp. SXout11W]|uniref:Spy/CpxP family protein refolding chaperone n=1 Tax=Undibacterium sp. SXout11W TaxID=3413050 RepID=UPI003BF39819